MSDNRKNAKQWFLTFPQLEDLRPVDAESSLEFFLEYMQQGLPDNKVTKAILCHEDHEEREADPDIKDCIHGGVHIHVVFQLERKWKMPSDMLFFDGLFGKHGKYETCRNFHKAIRYVGKEGDYATMNIDYDAVCLALGTRQAYGFHEAANAIYKEGKTLPDLVRDEKSRPFVLNHKRKLDDFIRLCDQIKKDDTPRVPFPGVQDVPDGPRNESHSRGEWQKVVDWINDVFSRPLTGEDVALWISGPSGIGKSRPFLDPEKIRKYRVLYQWCKKGQQQDISLCQAEYVLIDELCGSIYANDLKSITQHYGMMINFKSDDIREWRQRVPVVVTAQHSIRDTYKNIDIEDVRALQRRFLEVRPTTPYEILMKEDEPDDDSNGKDEVEEEGPRMEEID